MGGRFPHRGKTERALGGDGLAVGGGHRRHAGRGPSGTVPAERAWTPSREAALGNPDPDTTDQGWPPGISRRRPPNKHGGCLQDRTRRESPGNNTETAPGHIAETTPGYNTETSSFRGIYGDVLQGLHGDDLQRA